MQSVTALVLRVARCRSLPLGFQARTRCRQRASAGLQRVKASTAAGESLSPRRVLAVSDLHVDHVENLKWAEKLAARNHR